MNEERRDILFLCVANSARSQLAEGLARELAPAGVSVYSAGSEPGHLNPLAVAAMHERGIDISEQYSKAIDQVPSKRIAVVITLCAEQVCPIFSEDVTKLHWPLADPAAADPASPSIPFAPTDQATDDEQLDRFRRCRDEIEARIEQFFATSPAIDSPAGEGSSDV